MKKRQGAATISAVPIFPDTGRSKRPCAARVAARRRRGRRGRCSKSSFTSVVIDPGAVAVRRQSADLDRPELKRNAMDSYGEKARDGVQLAILNRRFESVARKMANPLWFGRSGVISTSVADFSCCIVTARNELLVSTDSLPIHVLSGPDRMAEAMQQFHPELRRGDALPFTTRPITAARTPPTTRSSCRGDRQRRRTASPSSPKRIRPIVATRSRRPTWERPLTYTKRGP